MKDIKSTLGIILFLLITNTLSAQYGNGGYGGGMGNSGYGNSGYGRNGMSQMQQREPEKPKEIPAEESAIKIVNAIKDKLQLDELQVIAITNVVTNSLKQQGIILKKDNNDQEKIEDIKALSETTDRKIMELLSKEQKEKYKIMVEEKRR
jgi:hypothetical protein